MTRRAFLVRRALLALFGVGAVCLVPWTVYLATTLPDQHGTHHWRLAWVGLDVALLGCFVAATWLGVHRHRSAVPLSVATAALLCCDAWFDVVLDWAEPRERMVSIITAVCVELPVAAILLLRARALLSDCPPRQRRSIPSAAAPPAGADPVVAYLAPDEAASLDAELGRLDAEYRRVLARYRRRTRPAPGTRRVALRWWPGHGRRRSGAGPGNNPQPVG